MFLLAAAALVTAQTVSGLAPVTPRVQARATVRIVRGTAVRFGGRSTARLTLISYQWCGREDSNFHGLSATATSTLRVYQFRHDRTS